MIILPCVKKTLALAIVLVVASLPILAETGGKTDTNPAEYITPDQLTSEDIGMLQEYSNSYNQCLTESSFQQLQTYDDPRQAVDIAMKQCAVHLEELNRKMMERNIEPGFIQGYIRRTNLKGSNIALRAAMIGAIQKQQNEQASEQSGGTAE